MTETILKEHPDFVEINKMFNDLKQEVRSKAEDTSKPGFGGAFTAEEMKSTNDIAFSMYSGGYEQKLHSNKFGFSLVENYTYADGTGYTFYTGSINELRAAYNEVFKEQKEMDNKDVSPSVKRVRP